MAKMKYYAIKTPQFEKIVTNWDECLVLIKGVKGVLYKSFKTLEEAENWLKGVSEEADSSLQIYVDGSFSPDFPYSGWGLVVVENNEEQFRLGGVTPEPAKSRNIDGELFAAIKALEWLKENQRVGTICHDYEGIARFAKGEWKAKSPVALEYMKKARPLLGENKFKKVDAHTGHQWNDLVDQIAKDAILDAKSKPFSLEKTAEKNGQFLLEL
ncbi:MAG TPA: ribonuclease H family protein [Fibrobacteraceae bacterium]|jgi:viroplasmin and RNaseH domain-containing protein|nr:ribonuclease H [Fibrobacter sp.]HPW95277.1 ribonuclease H family protein [Fibrobacteraceae bacterium]